MKPSRAYVGWVISPICRRSSNECERTSYGLGCAFAALLACALPVHALTLNEMGASLDACFEPSADMTELQDKLSLQAWISVAGDEITDEIIDHLAWAFVVDDVQGEAAKDALATALDTNRNNIRDTLTATDGSTIAMTRMVGRDRETVLVTRAPDGAGAVQQDCRFSLTARSAFGHAATDFAEPNAFDLGSAEDPRKITVILLNGARLNAKLTTPVTINATLETVKSFPAP